jgi:sugar phosphate permease
MLTGLVVSLFWIAYLVPYRTEYQNLIVFLTGCSGFFLYGPYSMTSGCLSLDIAGPEGSGSATGMLDGLGYLGGALAAWGAGYLSDVLGWTEVFYILSLLALVSVLSCWQMSRRFQEIAKSKAIQVDSYVASPVSI